jgi:ABC-type arginine transport system permease subunit
MVGRTTIGLVGFVPRIYPSAWGGGSAGDITTYKLGTGLTVVGYGLFVYGAFNDIMMVVHQPTAENAETAVLNTSAGAYTTFLLAFPEDVLVSGAYMGAKWEMNNLTPGEQTGLSLVSILTHL